MQNVSQTCKAILQHCKGHRNRVLGFCKTAEAIAALPLVSGMLELGLNKGAALAFLIAGPITILPAMAAVWGLVNKKVFLIYMSFALAGAMMFGLLYNLFG